MAHKTIKNTYKNLSKRLNLSPQGAPQSDLLFNILSILFSEEEAGLVARLPLRPFSVDRAAGIWKMNHTETRKQLEELAKRSLLVDIETDGKMQYVLPPPMAGFFEFSLMRLRDDINQKILSELFYEYMNVEEDFIRELFTEGETQLGRTFVNEEALSENLSLHVLDYEKASEVIRTASHIGIGTCYCRHKMEHLDRACKAPQDICMTFNNTAASLIRHGTARKVEAAECLDLLQEAKENNLVQFGENVRERVNFICNCCGCCCEAMIAARKFAVMDPVHTTNYYPMVFEFGCTGCGKCVSVCPVEAMGLYSENNPEKPDKKVVRLDPDRCLGCGVCVNVCPTEAIHLEYRESRVITPINGAHKTVLMAIERGKLQNLIFDNQVLWSHRSLAALLSVILKLPPAKQILAKRQVKSRYLEALLSRMF